MKAKKIHFHETRKSYAILILRKYQMEKMDFKRAKI